MQVCHLFHVSLRFTIIDGDTEYCIPFLGAFSSLQTDHKLKWTDKENNNDEQWPKRLF